MHKLSAVSLATGIQLQTLQETYQALETSKHAASNTKKDALPSLSSELEVSDATLREMYDLLVHDESIATKDLEAFRKKYAPNAVAPQTTIEAISTPAQKTATLKSVPPTSAHTGTAMPKFSGQKPVDIS